tara:strand:+ start:66 stop:530 length:465 start_codon:yes stop_codon:yes gene_type:complete
VANFLTTAQSFCYHEPLVDTTPLCLKAMLDRCPSDGIADTSLIHRPDEILHHFPDAKFVIMTGSKYSWTNFARDTLMMSETNIQNVENEFQRTKEMIPNALHVNVHGLMSDPTVAAQLQLHTTGSSDFDYKRWKQLRDMNVQVIPEALARRLTR